MENENFYSILKLNLMENEKHEYFYYYYYYYYYYIIIMNKN